MAKSSFWLRGAKGKLAGTTIYNSGGESVMRVINRSIKNPRTKAQMVQRVISKTVMNQYAALKAICDHSFQGKTAGAKCMAYFASINNKLLRKKISDAQNAGLSFNEIFNFIPCKSNKFIPTEVVISEGALPQIFTGGQDVASIDAVFSGNTYEDIINTLGLQRGDQLTFVTIEKHASTGEYIVNYTRVILDPRNSDGTPADLSTTFVAENKIVKPSFRNEGNFYSLDLIEGSLMFSILNQSVIASAVIASRQENNDWLRSTAVLDVQTTELNEGDNISLADAIALSTASTPIYTNASRILNNAGIGGPQAEGEEEGDNMVVTGYKLSDGAGAPTPFPAGGQLSLGIADRLYLFGENMQGTWLKVPNNGSPSQGVVNSEGTQVVFEEGNSAGDTYTFNGTVIVTVVE